MVFSGSVRFRCVALRYSKISESESISVWGHELANSFLLFRVRNCFLQMIN